MKECRNDRNLSPGKLFIAGEYAVVEPGHPAIIVAVDQFINVTIEGAPQNGSIQSAQYSTCRIRWTRRNGELVLDHRENPFHLHSSYIFV